jgi:archaeal flagellin FlaB
MLKRLLTKKKFFKQIYKEQKGITGLETAIILIAFVVVAAVFAYTVLSAGLFSTQKSQEAVYSGLQETQNTLVVKGGVLSQAEAKDTDDCETVAHFSGVADNGTVADNTTDIHQGSHSVLITGIGTPDVDDILANTATASITASEHDTVTFWAKYGTTGDNSKLGMAAAAAANGTVTASVSKALITSADDAWHLYTFDVHTSGDDQSLFLGVYAAATGFATHTVSIDDIQVNNVSLWDSTKAWTPYASDILLTLSLATGGQAIDFSPGYDDTAPMGVFTAADHSGIKGNKMVVNYNDKTQHVTDVAWTGTFIGNNNEDYMLDPGEKIQLRIDLTYINANAPSDEDRVVANHQFTLEVKAPKGAVLSFERTMPARLYGIDNLN